jgi:hypothetical protein
MDNGSVRLTHVEDNVARGRGPHHMLFARESSFAGGKNSSGQIISEVLRSQFPLKRADAETAAIALLLELAEWAGGEAEQIFSMHNRGLTTFFVFFTTTALNFCRSISMRSWFHPHLHLVGEYSGCARPTSSLWNLPCPDLTVVSDSIHYRKIVKK